ncbi:hypothetical protein ACIBSS_32710 [Micromonospora aurantiaca]|uniref:hypothetical protein n=1 Tax=Micromonospora aurantiaca (nom. illeg.) TaxID=47850 RepID=UPI0037BAE0CE
MDLYQQLARLVELLVGGQPATEVWGKAAAALVLGRQGQNLTRFYVGLRAAAVVDRRLPPAPAIVSGAAQPMRRAADAVGVMGDIIASHLTPGWHPDTLEGAAIRAGGGVHGGLGDIARLALAALRLDGRLPAWLDRGDLLGQTYRPVSEAARWASNSRLGAIARELIATAKSQPNLRELDIARAPRNPVLAVDTVDAAITAVRAARTWLWLHPDQVTGAHLQVGTQLGLAVHIWKGERLPATGGWRQAAIAAAELRATPAVGPAQDVIAELREALRWCRSQLNPGSHPHAQNEEREAARLGSEMVLTAATLYRGLRVTMRRQNLFVRGDAVLERPAGSLVYRAIPSWRPATADDDLIRDLRHALGQLTGSDAASVTTRMLARPPRLQWASQPAKRRPSLSDALSNDRERLGFQQREGRRMNPHHPPSAAMSDSEAVEADRGSSPGDITIE